MFNIAVFLHVGWRVDRFIAYCCIYLCLRDLGLELLHRVPQLVKRLPLRVHLHPHAPGRVKLRQGGGEVMPMSGVDTHAAGRTYQVAAA